jgi:hypothetical protein
LWGCTGQEYPHRALHRVGHWAARGAGCVLDRAGRGTGLRLCALGSGPAGLHCPARTGRENLPQAVCLQFPQVSGSI